MQKRIKAVILAAGKSTRMKSTKSKVLHKILGREIINLLLDSLGACGVKDEDMVVVVGENRKELEAAISRPIRYAIQSEPLGTAHALLCAGTHVASHSGDLLVLVGDNPYITAEELQRLIDHHGRTQAVCSFLSAVFADVPPPYGRILRDEKGEVFDIVEESDASTEQKKIREVNSSIYLFDNAIVFPRLQHIRNDNSKKEYYLTDIVRILKKERWQIEALVAEDPNISIGINNRWELQEAQKIISIRHMRKLVIESGITILQPESVTIEWGVEIGMDTVIYPNTYIARGTRIGCNCTIGPFAYLRGVEIPDKQNLSFVRLTEPKKN